MNYQYVWFDLGKTLVDFPRSVTYQEVLKEFDVVRTQEEIHKAYHLTDKLFMKQYPHILGTDEACFMPWYIGNLNYILKVQQNIVEVYHRLKEKRAEETIGWQLIPEAREVLNNLRKKGMKTGLISNWDFSCRKVLKENELLDLLDTVIISSEVGIEKPQKEIFEEAFKKGQTNAEKSLYVGDNYYDDVVGASQVDMDCVLINPYDREGIEEINYEKIIENVSEVMKFI